MNNVVVVSSKKAAQEVAARWYELERDIVELRRRADALRRVQSPLLAALELFTKEHTDDRNPLVEVGDRLSGFRLYFKWQPVSVRWKDIAVGYLSEAELTQLTDDRPIEAKLQVEPRNPQMM
jgi:hypothetical protein